MISVFWPVYLMILNVTDCFSTLFALRAGFAGEANPIMRYLYIHAPKAFVAFKLICGIGAPVMLWCFSRHYSMTRGQTRAIFGAFVFLSLMYTFVVGMQFALWHVYLTGSFC